MKNLLVALLILLVGPFLVCDPDASWTSSDLFEVTLNGVTYQSSPVDTVGNGYALRFDLAGKWKPGKNDVSVSLVNTWGQSEKVPFSFTAGPPLAPRNLSIKR